MTVACLPPPTPSPFWLPPASPPALHPQAPPILLPCQLRCLLYMICVMTTISYVFFLALFCQNLSGYQGNKGGVSIRLDVYGINLIIVNCHLAAHQDNMTERIIVSC